MANINKLTQSKSNYLQSIGYYTQNSATLDISLISLQQTYINSRECPYCSSHHVVSKGKYKGRRRYLCKECNRSYNDLTNTPFSGIHNLEKIKKYLTCMINGYSIRKAAKITEISVNTSFNWRHKLLSALNKLPSPNMKNVKEVMELKLPFSNKGQRVKIAKQIKNSKVSALFICDRTGKLDSDAITYSKRIENPLINRVAQNLNKHSEFFFNSNDSKLLPLSTTISYNCKSHYANSNLITQTVYNWQEWMKRFHGVATKYLRNYLHWFDFLDNTNHQQDQISLLAKLLINYY